MKLGNTRQTAVSLLCLGQTAMALGQTEKAEGHFRECVFMLNDFGESFDLGVVLLYLGKCLAAGQKTDAARETFKTLCRIGQTINLPSLISIGLLNIAQLLLGEGKNETALEMILTIRQFPLIVKTWQNESDRLWKEVYTKFSTQQINAIKQQTQDLTLESLLDRI